jgi:hypothetical protein
VVFPPRRIAAFGDQRRLRHPQRRRRLAIEILLVGRGHILKDGAWRAPRQF